MLDKEYLELADLLYPNTKDVNYYLNKFTPRATSGEVTRLAPSPTGYLHIGQLYQALIHRMLANSTGGIFYMRLEDTDNKREVENAGQIAYDMLCRFGLKPDEGYRGDNMTELGDYGPYVQSHRLEIYYAFAHELVKCGKAFPCFCQMAENKEEILRRREEELEETSDLEVKDPCRNLTLSEIKEKLSKGEKFALRLKSAGTKDKTFEFTDEIKGKKEIRENLKDDVLIKSNGIPVYAFAHIVDDTLMHTSIIVRGQEWFQSLPVHIELSKALNLPVFKYAHTPSVCVLDESGNKRKISKRKDTFADVRFFLEKGYPAEAVCEYLLNLLNSDFELWRKNNPTLHYFEFPFEIGKVGVTNPLFDFMKLNDISKSIISRYTAEQVYDVLVDWASEWKKESLSLIEANKEVLLKMFNIDRGGERPRKDITYFSEVLDLYNYVLPGFKTVKVSEFGNVNKQNLTEFLKYYAENYEVKADNQAWFEDLKEKALKFNFADNKTYKLAPSDYAGNISDASKFVRLAITGKENSPELYSIMKILGQETCKARLNEFIKNL
ncbi:MAG: glutamate--tRNA ligase family protein [Clostridia bacterium]|nr:glutamate--tRNA ligase family protein [Clostridia bacterium]